MRAQLADSYLGDGGGILRQIQETPFFRLLSNKNKIGILYHYHNHNHIFVISVYSSNTHLVSVNFRSVLFLMIKIIQREPRVSVIVITVDKHH